ncbi:hypothetical protein CNMCM5623_006344 [Aspergillus felis]|uniref:BZIP domain-containing protein n=1 Tax=Aspergillus felis TaxID=1287682 RepID=A0A8H6QHP6_9EURO|nr:hypothetical protein CNMCM5623_006344 [Aspergillus felis]
MNTDESHKKLSRLARVRENQRKSRARKRNHVQELEQRLASSKEDAKRKDIERKLLVQKIEAENRKLKGLLTFLGMQASVIETYLHMDDNSNATRKVAIPALRDSEETISLPCQKSRHGRPCSLQHRARDNASSAELLEQPVASASCQQSLGLAKESVSSLKRPEDSVPGVPCQQSPGPSTTALHLQDRSSQYPAVPVSSLQTFPKRALHLLNNRTILYRVYLVSNFWTLSRSAFKRNTIPSHCQPTNPYVAVSLLMESWTIGLSMMKFRIAPFVRLRSN